MSRRSACLVLPLLFVACGREPAVTTSGAPAVASDAGPPAVVAASAPAPRRPPVAAPAPAPAPAVTAIACPAAGGDALGLKLRYEGRSTVTAAECRAFDLAKTGLKEVPGDPGKDHFKLFAADGRLLFTGIWFDPFAPMEGPIADHGPMTWTTGEVRPAQTWELVVPNRPEGKVLELWAVAHPGAAPVLKARVTLR